MYFDDRGVGSEVIQVETLPLYVVIDDRIVVLVTVVTGQVTGLIIVSSGTVQVVVSRLTVHRASTLSLHASPPSTAPTQASLPDIQD